MPTKASFLLFFPVEMDYHDTNEAIEVTHFFLQEKFL